MGRSASGQYTARISQPLNSFAPMNLTFGGRRLVIEGRPGNGP